MSGGVGRAPEATWANAQESTCTPYVYAEMQQVMGKLVDEGQVPWWWVFVVLTRNMMRIVRRR
jgi:hypothetical protein